MSVPKLETRNADACEHHIEQAGLVVGVHAITDKAEADQVFNANLLNKGILPILLVAENRNASDSFIITKEKVYVVDEQTLANAKSQRKDVTSGQVAAGTVMTLVGPLFVGLKMLSDATVIQHNLADKEFYSRTLAPGQKAQGFIYFQFTNPASLARTNYHVVAQVKDSSADKIIPFDLKLQLAPPKP